MPALPGSRQPAAVMELGNHGGGAPIILAAYAELSQNRGFTQARIAVLGRDEIPIRLTQVEAALTVSLSAESLESARDEIGPTERTGKPIGCSRIGSRLRVQCSMTRGAPASD